MRTWTRLSTVLALAGASTLAACGGGGSSADARVTDANTTPDVALPDGSPDARVLTRSATLAVAEVALSTPTTPPFPSNIGGASVSFSFSDVTQGGGHVVFGDGAPGGCLVTEYDGGETPTLKPFPLVGEGTITVAGAGLKRATPACNFVNGSYICAAAPVTGAAGSVASQNKVTILTVTGTTFDASQIGMWVSLSGMTDTTLNGTFPIVNVAGGSAVLATAHADAAPADFTGANYTLIQGLGPVPSGALTVSYLDRGQNNDPITVDMPATDDYPDGIHASLVPLSKGLKLSGAGTGCEDCSQPHLFPTQLTANNTVSFSCDSAKGDGTGVCDTAPSGGLWGVVITGVTTTGDVANVAPYAMPPSKPGTKYVTFTCSALLDKTRQIPHEVLAAIFATNPTRIETRVFSFSFAPVTDTVSTNTANVLAGHGIIGHTTIPLPGAK